MLVLWAIGKNHILVRELLSLPCVCMMAADIKNHLTAVLCKRTDLLNIIVMRQFCGPRYTNITSCWGSGRLPNSYIIDGFGVDSTNDDQGRKTEEKNISNIRYHY